MAHFVLAITPLLAVHRSAGPGNVTSPKVTQRCAEDGKALEVQEVDSFAETGLLRLQTEQPQQRFGIRHVWLEVAWVRSISVTVLV